MTLTKIFKPTLLLLLLATLYFSATFLFGFKQIRDILLLICVPILAAMYGYLSPLKEKSGQKLKSANLVFLLSALYFLLSSVLKQMKFNGEHYQYFDTGLYLYRVNQLSKFGLFDQRSIDIFTEGHIQPILHVISVVTQGLYQPWLLLFLQTVVMLFSVFILFRICRLHKLTEFQILFVCTAFILNPVFFFNDILGFNPDHLMLPITLGYFYFYSSKNMVGIFLTVLSICLVSEPWYLTGIAMGLHLIFESRTRPLGFLFLSFYSVLLILFFSISNESNPASLHSLLMCGNDCSPYGWLSAPSLQSLEKVFLNPMKWFYLSFWAALYAMLIVTGSRSGLRHLILICPDLAKALLSTETLHFSIFGHYTPVILGALTYFIVTWMSQSDWKSIFVRRLATMHYCVVIGYLLTISPFPVSVAFWTDFAKKTYNIQNYRQPDIARREVVEKKLLEVDNLKFDHIEISNNAFSSVVFRFDTIDIFPSKRWATANVLILSKVPDDLSDGNTMASTLKSNYLKALPEIGNYFDTIFSDKKIVVFVNKKQDENG